MPCKDYDTATMPCKDYVRRLEKRYNIIEQTTVTANYVAASWYVQSVSPADATSRGVPWAPLPVPPDVNLTISKRKWEDLFMRYRHELAVIASWADSYFDKINAEESDHAADWPLLFTDIDTEVQSLLFDDGVMSHTRANTQALIDQPDANVTTMARWGATRFVANQLRVDNGEGSASQ